MKILFFTGSFKTGIGGVASYAHDFVDAFSHKYDFVIITNDNYSKKEKYPIYQIKMTDFSISNAKRLLDIIKIESPNIIINSYFPLLSLVTPFIPNNIKIISISHFTDGKLAWAAGLNANYIDYIVSLSTFGKKYLEKKFHIPASKKIKIIYNYMKQLPQINVSEKKSRKILKIVYPGGCSYQKSAEIVCKALKLLLRTNYKFEFYWLGSTQIPGNKWPGVNTKYIQDCFNINDPRIKHIGPVDREEAKKIMSDTNIFLLPSRGEGCPITLLEAMRGGCIPIISNAKHGSLDIIKHKENGIIVKQDNAEEIVHYLCDILQTPSKYNFIYDNTISTFSTNLEYDIWVKEMTKILTAPTDHKTRIEFSKILYNKNKRYLKRLYFTYWLKDRFIHQFYHFIYFRYLKYIVK